jgi:hypothetical protein
MPTAEQKSRTDYCRSESRQVLKPDKDKMIAGELKKPVCGIVMPISAIDNCAESHWAEVLEILTDAIEKTAFDANIVSNADDVGIIHKRIIQNLYDNPLVVCDVSGKNPNVMFELGLRLAFDKPTIIVKDDKTSFSFDTAAMEHLEYPRDLRLTRIVEFKQKLSEKIAATYKKATSDPSYTTFLKHFGEFTVAKLDKNEVSGQEYILEELRHLRSAVGRLEGTMPIREMKPRFRREFKPDIEISLKGRSESEQWRALMASSDHPGLRGAVIAEDRLGDPILRLEFKPSFDAADVLNDLKAFLPPDPTVKVHRDASGSH